MRDGVLSRAGRFLLEQKKHRRWMVIFLFMAAGVALGTLGFLKLYGEAMTHRVRVLNCKYEVHTHTGECYTEDEDGEKVLVCEHADEAEYAVHVHNDDCYSDKGDLLCPLEEHEEHEHDDSCYEEEKVLVCGLEETEISGGADAAVKDAASDAREEVSQPEEEVSAAESVSEKEPVLVCEKEVHTHDDNCYPEPCKLEEHTHDDMCVSEELVCEEEEHKHEDNCYDEDGGLTCELEEHEHDEKCYKEINTCGLEEHTHDDTCQATEPSCGLEEHEHDNSCYEQQIKEPEAALERPGSEPEEKTEPEETTSEKTEPEETGHVHTEDCYETHRVLTCGELELHTHDDDPDSDTCCYDKDCFDEDGSLIEGSRASCGMLQLEEHIHNEEDECFDILELTDEEVGALNNGATLHVHSDTCYDSAGGLICGYEVTHLHQLECYDENGHLICGFGGEKHEHDAACYDEEGNLICGFEKAKDHEHDAGCYDEDGSLTCGYKGVKDHEHSAACYDEEHNLICGYEGVKDHEHDAACYDILGNLICGYEGVPDHVHTEVCYDEEGNLICGREVAETFEYTRSYEGDGYLVVARYNEDAKIPEDAEFIAERITPDSDQEHYASRETEFRNELQDETASMRALLKIGFYTGEGEERTEIEPETPVVIAVQFLDEDGLAEGKPITVIHFMEEGMERLDGSDAKNNSTSFKMNSFSEIAIGYEPEEEKEIEVGRDGIGRLHLSDSFEYEDDAFHITFHIEGDAIVPEGTDLNFAAAGTDVKEEQSLDAQKAESSLDEGTQSSGAQEEASAGEETDMQEEESAEETLDVQEEVTEEEESVAQEESDSREESAVQEGFDAEADAAEPGNAEKTPDQNTVEGEGPRTRFTVERADKDSEEYNFFKEYAEKFEEDDEMVRLCVLNYALTYGDVKLDLSECNITAEISLTQTVKDGIETSASDMAAYLLNNEGEVIKNGGERTALASVAVTENKEKTEKDADTSSEPEKEAADSAQAADGNTADAAEIPEEKTGNAVQTADKDAADTAQSPDKTAAGAAQVSDKDTADAPQGSDEYSETAETRNSSKDTEELPTEEADKSGSKIPQADADGEADAAGDGTEFKISIQTRSAPAHQAAVINELEKEVCDGSSSYTVALSDNESLGVALSAKANPTFTVEYYANLSVLKESGGTALTIIDTDNGGENKGGILPKNGETRNTKSIYVDGDGVIQRETKPVEVYKARTFQYSQAPSLMYFNSLVRNDQSYELKEIWVKQPGAGENDWTVKPYSEDLHFTNRQEVLEGKDNYMLIAEGTVIRLVYDIKNSNFDADTAFYDYDITDGKIYSEADLSAAKRNRESAPSAQNKWYLYTEQQGINSPQNYPEGTTNGKLAFGNSESIAPTGLGNQTCGGYNINQANGSVQGGGTFGLVTGLTEDGKLIYADGVHVPNLFNEGDAAGKTPYTDKQLRFIRQGDTYILSAVKEKGAESLIIGGLENLSKTRDNWNHTKKLYSNGFWPLDHVASAGTDGHDPLLGTNCENKRYFNGKTGNDKKDMGTPEDDYGADHNAYFGMMYTVKFDLSRDYIGPLEYYFFGDDDLWVFLDGELVCDIGGVHGSVGEYVNLWDYIDRQANIDHEHTNACYDENGDMACDETHTLSFFYTERGASGSTCWMQFTIPSVSSMTPEQVTGQFTNSLRVGKTVSNVPTDMQYPFRIHFFKTQGGEDLPDDYSYSKFRKVRQKDADGNPLFDADGMPLYVQKTDENGNLVYEENGDPVYKAELIEQNFLIHDGDTFTLGDGEYIIINYLPVGTWYTIEEVEKSEEYDIIVNDKENNSGEVSGDISQDTVINYVNDYIVFNLPKTGGPGPEVYAIAGALLILFGAGFLYKKKFRERRV